MNQGIFGIVDFSKGIDHPNEIIRTVSTGGTTFTTPKPTGSYSFWPECAPQAPSFRAGSFTFGIWYHFYIENNSLEVSPPCLSDYLKA